MEYWDCLLPGFFLAAGIFLLLSSKKADKGLHPSFRSYLNHLRTAKIPRRNPTLLASLVFGTLFAVLSKRLSHELFSLWALATSSFLAGTMIRLFLHYQENRLLGLAVYRWKNGTPERIWSLKDEEAVPCRTQEDGSLTLIVRFKERGRPRKATVSIEKDGKVEVLSID